MTGGTSLPHSGNAMEIPFSSRTGWMSPDSSILSKTYVYLHSLCVHIYMYACIRMFTFFPNWLIEAEFLHLVKNLCDLYIVMYSCVHVCVYMHIYILHEPRGTIPPSYSTPTYYIQLHIHMYIFMCIYAYSAQTEPNSPIQIMFAYVCAHVHAYVYVGVYICIHVYTYIYLCKCI